MNRFTSIINIYDGLDLYTEVMRGEDWRVAINLHQIIMQLPDFIESTKQLEDTAIEQHEVKEAKNLLNQVDNEPMLH